MKSEKLFRAFGGIDDNLIFEAMEKKRAKNEKAKWIKIASVAACLVLVTVIGVLLHSKDGAKNTGGNTAPKYQGYLYQESVDNAEPRLINTAYILENENVSLPVTLENNSVIVGMNMITVEKSVDTADEMEEARRYAYMDLESATPEEAEKITEARRKIIFNESWIADGFTGYIVNMQTGEKTPVPSFSELFPDWDISIASVSYDLTTEDGLGKNALYGLTLKIIEIKDDLMVCENLKDINKFKEGDLITVFYPDDFLDAGALEVGYNVFVAYFGKNCNLNKCEITACSIEIMQ